jgi:predicted DNA-binding protein
MPTTNPRINVTVSNEVAAILRKTAKQTKKSISRVAFDLIEWAIEEREDEYFSRIADSVELSNPKWVKDNDEIWN